MLPNDTSPSSVSQIDETLMIDRDQHYEKLTFSHHLNAMNNSGGRIPENESNYDTTSSPLAGVASSSSSSGMDMYLSPHTVKDYYGPNVAKYYTTAAGGKGETTYTSLTYDTMSNVALSDLYSHRDEFSILHSDMRPSQAPWLYAVNKHKARESLIGDKNKTAADSSFVSTATKRQRSPQFDVISKRTVPRLNDKKKKSPRSEAIDKKDDNHNLGKGSVDNLYNMILPSSPYRYKGMVFRAIALMVIAVILWLYGRSHLHPHKAFSTSQPWQKSASLSTTYIPMSLRTNSAITSLFWDYKSSMPGSSISTSISATSERRTEKVKSKLKSGKKKIPFKKKINK